MESGETAHFKNKSPDEIEIDMEEIELDIDNNENVCVKTKIVSIFCLKIP